MKVFTIPLPPIMTNCHIAYEREGGKCFIIDPASSEDKIIANIKLMKLAPKAILLTHGHFDHIAAADKLRDIYAIPLYVHEKDGDMICNPALNCSLSMTGAAIKLCKADKLLKDKDVLKLEKETLTVMHTPGHSPGSCVFLGNNLIFSGDTVFKGTYGRYDLPGGNYNDLMESLERVLSLDPYLKIYPGHDSTTTVGDERSCY